MCNTRRLPRDRKKSTPIHAAYRPKTEELLGPGARGVVPISATDLRVRPRLWRFLEFPAVEKIHSDSPLGSAPARFSQEARLAATEATPEYFWKVNHSNDDIHCNGTRRWM